MVQINYDVNDAYWKVTGLSTLIVWSSARFLYVPTRGDTDFQAWVNAGNQVIQVTNQQVLAGVMRLQRVPNYLSTGLAITFSQNTALSATYALDPTTINEVRTLAYDTAVGFGFPSEAVSFDYPDFNGNLLSFSPTEMQQLYMALRDYTNAVIQSVTSLVYQSPGAAMPTASVTI